MQDCYADGAIFNDEVFNNLNADVSGNPLQHSL